MSNLLTVKQFSQKHQAFSEGSLRWLIFNARERFSASGEPFGGNGLEEAGAILRIGRKVLIDEEKFFDWTEARSAEVS